MKERKVIHAIDEALQDRLGRCFELSGKYVASNPSWDLVHAVITDKKFGTGGTLTHAWCEKGDEAYDPVMEHRYPKTLTYSLYGVVDYKVNPYEKRMGTPETLKVTYTSSEAREHMIESGTYGPWDKRIDNYKCKVGKKQK